MPRNGFLSLLSETFSSLSNPYEPCFALKAITVNTIFWYVKKSRIRFHWWAAEATKTVIIWCGHHWQPSVATYRVHQSADWLSRLFRLIVQTENLWLIYLRIIRRYFCLYSSRYWLRKPNELFNDIFNRKWYPKKEFVNYLPKE